jgi:hypothetical protein
VDLIAQMLEQCLSWLRSKIPMVLNEIPAARELRIFRVDDREPLQSSGLTKYRIGRKMIH